MLLIEVRPLHVFVAIQTSVLLRTVLLPVVPAQLVRASELLMAKLALGVT